MNKIISWIALAVAVIALVFAVVGGNDQPQELGSGTRFPNGISADATAPAAGELRGADLTLTDDATIAGRSLTLTTSNTSTSTFSGGCIQTTATSTQTPIRFMIGSTVVASSTYTGVTTSNGVVHWGYGTCPI